MKLGRLVALLTAVAIIMLVPLSNVLGQKEEPVPDMHKKKVTICHFPDGKDLGRVITVSRNALDTHIKMHGDATRFQVSKGNPKECRRVCKFQRLCHKGEVWDPLQCKCVKRTKCDPKDPKCEQEIPK